MQPMFPRSPKSGRSRLPTIGGSLATALSDPASREAALITFLASAAKIQMLGIGGAFWGLVIGLIAYFVLRRGQSKGD